MTLQGHKHDASKSRPVALSVVCLLSAKCGGFHVKQDFSSCAIMSVFLTYWMEHINTSICDLYYQ